MIKWAEFKKISDLVFAQFRVGSFDSLLLDPVGQSLWVRYNYANKACLKANRWEADRCCANSSNLTWLWGSIFSWPVNCPHEQISGPQVHWDYRPFRSSLGRCIHPAPAWKYSSSCQWSSACRSVTHHNRKTIAPVLYTSAHNYVNSMDGATEAVLLTGSHFPMSPVCSHPSLSSASAVFSGSFRYPWNTFVPLMHTYKEFFLVLY